MIDNSAKKIINKLENRKQQPLKVSSIILPRMKLIAEEQLSLIKNTKTKKLPKHLTIHHLSQKRKNRQRMPRNSNAYHLSILDMTAARQKSANRITTDQRLQSLRNIKKKKNKRAVSLERLIF